MIPKTLTLKDFGSYADLEVDFSELSLAAIVGPNGSGKSTILDAVRVALFGRAAGTLDDYIRQGSKRLFVTLDFDVAGESYRVERQQGKSGQRSMIYKLDGEHASPITEDKVRAVDEKVVEVLGCNYEDFTLAHWLPQGALGKMAQMSPAERKEWLSSVIGLEAYDALLASAKKRKSAASESLIRAQAVIEATDVPDLEEATNRLDAAEAAHVSSSKRVAVIRDEHAEAVLKLERIRSAQEASRIAQTVVSGATARVKQAKEAQDLAEQELASARSTLGVEPPIMPDTKEQKYDHERLRTQKSEWEALKVRADAAERAEREAKARMVSAGEKAQRIISLLTTHDEAEVDRCENCGHPLSKQHAARTVEIKADLEVAQQEQASARDESDARISEYREAIEALEAVDIKEVDSQLEALTTQIRLADETMRARQTYDKALVRVQGLDSALTSAMDTLRRAQASLDEANGEYKDIGECDPAEMKAAQDDSNLLNTALDEAMKLESSARTEKALATAEVGRAKKAAGAIAEAKKDIEELTSKLDIAELAVKAYGKAGIRARIMERAVDEIAALTNEFLSHFESSLEVDIIMQAATKDGKGLKETLDIEVSDALGARPTKHSGAIESFVVDEPEYLDVQGIEELVECLHVLSKSTPLVLLISHIQEVTEAMPQRIEVSKGESSSVEVIV